ncbi:ring-opening amidohydrolase [Ferrovibrio terrae]|uniref:ring-opening amidohydrolase n=1 Tax=Ferrovibrio terrae TaxID=2594003 RepID=UPI003137C899
MPRLGEVFSFGMAAPADMSALTAAISAGQIDPAAVVCIYVKTEGNGQDNDFSRDVAAMTLQEIFSRYGAAPVLIASGGCEGVLSPHYIVVQRRTGDAPGAASARALAIGHARTRLLAAEEIGTLAQAHATADAVAQAMQDAGMTAADVAFVQIKAALLTDAAIADAAKRKVAVRAVRPHASKPLTRAACAIGVAAALGELDMALLTEAAIDDASLQTDRAIVTPGNTDMRCDIIVFGQADGWAGPHRVGAAPLQDLIDLTSATGLLRRLGFTPDPQLPAAESARIDGVLFKGDPPAAEVIRGRRHVIWRDSDVQPPRHVRAAVGGMLSSLLGNTRVFCAGGAEHQGPEGGGVLAIFSREADDA